MFELEKSLRSSSSHGSRPQGRWLHHQTPSSEEVRWLYYTEIPRRKASRKQETETGELACITLMVSSSLSPKHKWTNNADCSTKAHVCTSVPVLYSTFTSCGPCTIWEDANGFFPSTICAFSWESRYLTRSTLRIILCVGVPVLCRQCQFVCCVILLFSSSRQWHP